MYCKYCGKPIDDDSTFCKYCGKSLNLKDNSIVEIDTCTEDKEKEPLDKVLDKPGEIKTKKKSYFFVWELYYPY